MPENQYSENRCLVPLAPQCGGMDSNAGGTADGAGAHVSAATVAVTLGVAERGEGVKTFSNQGAGICRPEIANALWALKLCRRSGDVMFTISEGQFRKAWKKVVAEKSLPVGPPRRLCSG